MNKTSQTSIIFCQQNNSGCGSSELADDELTPDQIYKVKNGFRVRGEVKLRGRRSNNVIVLPEDRYVYVDNDENKNNSTKNCNNLYSLRQSETVTYHTGITIKNKKIGRLKGSNERRLRNTDDTEIFEELNHQNNNINIPENAGLSFLKQSPNQSFDKIENDFRSQKKIKLKHITTSTVIMLPEDRYTFIDDDIIMKNKNANPNDYEMSSDSVSSTPIKHMYNWFRFTSGKKYDAPKYVYDNSISSYDDSTSLIGSVNLTQWITDLGVRFHLIRIPKVLLHSKYNYDFVPEVKVYMIEEEMGIATKSIVNNKELSFCDKLDENFVIAESPILQTFNRHKLETETPLYSNKENIGVIAAKWIDEKTVKWSADISNNNSVYYNNISGETHLLTLAYQSSTLYNEGHQKKTETNQTDINDMDNLIIFLMLNYYIKKRQFWFSTNKFSVNRAQRNWLKPLTERVDEHKNSNIIQFIPLVYLDDDDVIFVTDYVRRFLICYLNNFNQTLLRSTEINQSILFKFVHQLVSSTNFINSSIYKSIIIKSKFKRPNYFTHFLTGNYNGSNRCCYVPCDMPICDSSSICSPSSICGTFPICNPSPNCNTQSFCTPYFSKMNCVSDLPICEPVCFQFAEPTTVTDFCSTPKTTQYCCKLESCSPINTYKCARYGGPFYNAIGKPCSNKVDKNCQSQSILIPSRCQPMLQNRSQCKPFSIPRVSRCVERFKRNKATVKRVSGGKPEKVKKIICKESKSSTSTVPCNDRANNFKQPTESAVLVTNTIDEYVPVVEVIDSRMIVSEVSGQIPSKFVVLDSDDSSKSESDKIPKVRKNKRPIKTRPDKCKGAKISGSPIFSHNMPPERRQNKQPCRTSRIYRNYICSDRDFFGSRCYTINKCQKPIAQPLNCCPRICNVKDNCLRICNVKDNCPRICNVKDNCPRICNVKDNCPPYMICCVREPSNGCKFRWQAYCRVPIKNTNNHDLGKQETYISKENRNNVNCCCKDRGYRGHSCKGRMRNNNKNQQNKEFPAYFCNKHDNLICFVNEYRKNMAENGNNSDEFDFTCNKKHSVFQRPFVDTCIREICPDLTAQKCNVVADNYDSSYGSLFSNNLEKCCNTELSTSMSCVLMHTRDPLPCKNDLTVWPGDLPLSATANCPFLSLNTLKGKQNCFEPCKEVNNDNYYTHETNQDDWNYYRNSYGIKNVCCSKVTLQRRGVIENVDKFPRSDTDLNFFDVTNYKIVKVKCKPSFFTRFLYLFGFKSRTVKSIPIKSVSVVVNYDQTFNRNTPTPYHSFSTKCDGELCRDDKIVTLIKESGSSNYNTNNNLPLFKILTNYNFQTPKAAQPFELAGQSNKNSSTFSTLNSNSFINSIFNQRMNSKYNYHKTKLTKPTYNFNMDNKRIVNNAISSKSNRFVKYVSTPNLLIMHNKKCGSNSVIPFNNKPKNMLICNYTQTDNFQRLKPGLDNKVSDGKSLISSSTDKNSFIHIFTKVKHTNKKHRQKSRDRLKLNHAYLRYKYLEKCQSMSKIFNYRKVFVTTSIVNNDIFVATTTQSLIIYYAVERQMKRNKENVTRFCGINKEAAKAKLNLFHSSCVPFIYFVTVTEGDNNCKLQQAANYTIKSIKNVTSKKKKCKTKNHSTFDKNYCSQQITEKSFNLKDYVKRQIMDEFFNFSTNKLNISLNAIKRETVVNCEQI